MNETQKETPLEEMAVNGIRVGDLPMSTQKIFARVVAMKREVDELKAKLDQKEAGLRELADMVVLDVSSYKAAIEVSTTTDTAQ